MNALRIDTVLLLPLLLACTLQADTSIHASNRYAYSANAGWVDACADTNHGAVIGEFVCSGWLYGANIGWICLGDGAPADGYQYGNASSNDWGVNHGGAGNLRGYAYGANVGWIKFADLGAPTVDLLTGRLSGHAYGANIGWIGFSNVHAHVRTANLVQGASGDGDSIPDGWEYRWTNTLDALLDGRDSDRDGKNDDEEYECDTDPFDDGDFLRFTAIEAATVSNATVTWASRPTRLYRVQDSTNLPDAGAWTDTFPGLQTPDPGETTEREISCNVSNPATFFRVKAVRPLSH
ncbi:MAG: hypothetical protein JW951_01315 [Lentisphaerae bacterium]|nr:hypothetical protein [Lentisphaerota bacterium]